MLFLRLKISRKKWKTEWQADCTWRFDDGERLNLTKIAPVS